MIAKQITPVTAFVDWNSQIHAAKPPRGTQEMGIASKTLTYVGKVIGRALYDTAPAERFNVELRIYHGWYKGFEATPRRKALVQTIAGLDFLSLSAKPNVSIRERVEFGDNLFSALEIRRHDRLRCHLPNTLRNSVKKTKDGDAKETEEKMVDTAIASDVVDLAYKEPKRWLLVIGDDDDLVPPTFVAEGVRRVGDGKIILIRTREDTPFLNLANLRYKP